MTPEKKQYLDEILERMVILENEFYKMSLLNESEHFDDSVNELLAEQYPFNYSLEEMYLELRKWASGFKENINE